MTLLRSSKRSCDGKQGLHPCLYSVVPKGLTFVLFYKTFWADGGWWIDGLEGDAPTEFYKVER